MLLARNPHERLRNAQKISAYDAHGSLLFRRLEQRQYKNDTIWSMNIWDLSVPRGWKSASISNLICSSIKWSLVFYCAKDTTFHLIPILFFFLAIEFSRSFKRKKKKKKDIIVFGITQKNNKKNTIKKQLKIHSENWQSLLPYFMKKMI